MAVNDKELQADEAQEQETDESSESADDLLNQYANVTLAALDLAFPDGIPADLKSLSFDFTAEDGSVKVSAVDASDQSTEATVSADDIVSMLDSNTGE